MAKVTIRRCPVCNTIRSHADQVEAILKKEPGLQVEVVDGGKGEFSVQVDGRTVSKPRGGTMPDVNEVLSAVKHHHPPPART